MTRAQAVNAALMVLASESTTAQQILALNHLYDQAYGDGVVAGGRVHSQAVDLIQNGLPPHGVAS